MLRSVLVANRGEIAVRVIRACRALGVRSVAVFSEADRRALHVLEADAAACIGPGPAAESYLDQGRIIRAAQEIGAEGIHPGYGFLAENPDFGEACQAAGLVWIGPPPAAMRALGDKARAKALAESVGVPTLAGFHDEEQDPDVLAGKAAEIGFPLLIKASAGGGGRGMRLVEGPHTFREQLEAAQREAVAAFGDGRVLLERYVARPRHVEVQILGDAHGNVVHLGERECTIQRRNQKLVEESPSPVVDADLRARMGAAALTLARSAGYWNAGTVEFLLARDGQFSFLEVNARLQVEHPVTELVTSLDLVALQLRVASGEPLPFGQAEVRLSGHAIETRVIAEDPEAGFLPSVGRVDVFEPPPFARNDVGVYSGAEVPPYYDSLLAKLIVFGPDRETAVERLAEALRSYRVEGVKTNLDLLLAISEDPAFLAGDLHTGYLAERRIVETLRDVPPEAIAAAAAADFAPNPPRMADPWRGPAAWRVGRVDQPSDWLAGERLFQARVDTNSGDAATVRIEDATIDAEALHSWRGQQVVRVGSANALIRQIGDRERLVRWQGRTHRLRRRPPPSVDEARAARGGGDGSLVAPMPGRVVRVAVHEGQRVHANQTLVVLEAMKMEHVVEAPSDGVVRRVLVEVGDQVSGDDLLVELGEEG